MTVHLLEPLFRVVLDDDSKSFRLLTHDLEAAEMLWNNLLGVSYETQTVIDPLLGSGIQFNPLPSASAPTKPLSS